MKRLNLPLRVLLLAAVLGAISITPVLAQSATPAPVQTIATCDGQTFTGQSLETQNQFIATFGANAADIWAEQHNAALMAAGTCAPPPPPVAAARPPVEVVVEEVGNSNGNANNNGNSNGNNNGNANNNDNGNNNNGNSNDNADHRPSVSLFISKDEVNRNESFEIRVSAEREHAARLSRIWWWATNTDDSQLRDTHTHECDDSDSCRHEWQESTHDGGRTIRIHARARDRDGRDSDEVTTDIRVH
jgi:hypothetical protein